MAWLLAFVVAFAWGGERAAARASGDGAVGAVGVSTGDRSGGWIFVPSGVGRGLSEGAGMLHFLPADAPPGTILSGTSLAASPAALGSLDRRIVVVFEPVEADAERGERIRQVRELSAVPGPREPIHFYSQMSPLAPLSGEGALEGFALTESGPFAVLGPARILGEMVGRRFLELRRGEWQPVERPLGLDLSRPFALGALDGAALVYQESAGGSGAHWVRTSDAAKWNETEMEALPAGSKLLEAQGQALALAPQGDSGGMELLIARAGRWFAITELAMNPEAAWVAPVGATVALVTLAAEPQGEFACRVVGVSGDVLYEGESKATGPVGRRELEVLALLLVSLLVTIGVFVFKPPESDREAINLPEGSAIAEPWRRMAATGIDALLVALASSIVWNTSVWHILDLAVMVTHELGVWPMVTAAGLLFVSGTLGEWLTGRTLGKWMLGCRVISRGSVRITLRQALARNAVKVMCPPLAVMSLSVGGPGQGAAVGFGTLVISAAKGAKASPAESLDTDERANDARGDGDAPKAPDDEEGGKGRPD